MVSSGSNNGAASIGWYFQPRLSVTRTIGVSPLVRVLTRTIGVSPLERVLRIRCELVGSGAGQLLFIEKCDESQKLVQQYVLIFKSRKYEIVVVDQKKTSMGLGRTKKKCNFGVKN